MYLPKYDAYAKNLISNGYKIDYSDDYILNFKKVSLTRKDVCDLHFSFAVSFDLIHDANGNILLEKALDEFFLENLRCIKKRYDEEFKKRIKNKYIDEGGIKKLFGFLPLEDQEKILEMVERFDKFGVEDVTDAYIKNEGNMRNVYDELIRKTWEIL